MKITVIKPFDVQDACEAWRLSRDISQRTKFAEISSTDAPVNELPSAVLHFEDFTILEREIFASLRGHVMWARTSRVDDPFMFTVPEELAPLVDTNEVRLTMAEARIKGVPQDTWRGLLPIAAHTAWTMRLSWRETVKLILYFNYLWGVMPNPQAMRFFQIANKLGHVIDHGDLSYKLEQSYKLEHYLNESEIIHKYDRSLRIGDFKNIFIKVPLMLRAQLVRHRPISFVDDLFINMKRPDIYNCTMQGLMIQMQCMAPTSFWNSISSKRNCWIAQHDIWAPVIQVLGSDNTVLPCANGAPCPYWKDNVLRAEGKDPSPPCPIWCDRSIVGKDRSAMRKYAVGRPDFWQDEIGVD